VQPSAKLRGKSEESEKEGFESDGALLTSELPLRSYSPNQ